MQIVIDISEDVYTRLFDNGIQDNEISVDDVCEMARAIRLGTQLPKQEDILDKIQVELYANAELHEDGDYYLREEWIGEIFDKYKAESEEKE